MNAAISSVVRAQTSNSATATKMERETIKSAEQLTGGQNISVESSVSSKYDTVELSRQYVEYKTQGQNSTLHDQTSQLNSTLTGSQLRETTRKLSTIINCIPLRKGSCWR
jgi:hypothetical protein